MLGLEWGEGPAPPAQDTGQGKGGEPAQRGCGTARAFSPPRVWLARLKLLFKVFLCQVWLPSPLLLHLPSFREQVDAQAGHVRSCPHPFIAHPHHMPPAPL